MDEDIDELELFEDRGFVCAVRIMRSKFDDENPWYQGVVYVNGRKREKETSNWYLQREQAIKMAQIIVNMAVRGHYR